ncbi:MAG: heparinase II/III family protein [Armatimonadota bacterium]
MRRHIPTVALAILAVANITDAGPLFDDYLNPVRPGISTGPGNTSISTQPGKGIGQTFTLPSNVGEIYRIGVRPVYDTWDIDETVTLTLYTDQDKRRKLGSYSINAATSHVQEYVIGDGSHFRQTGDRVLFFQLRTPISGQDKFYLELTADGGDSKVAFQAFTGDAYPDGKAMPSSNVEDLSFECHVKLVVDRERNLRQFFMERLDLSRPELAAVKAAVEASDWEQAIAETVKHFHNRMDLWKEWQNVMNVQVDPNADTSTADLILRGMVIHADKGNPIPWRKESWWTPEIPDAKMPNHGIQPEPSLWHFDRILAAAYTATGKPEYARAAIDLRIQWILDNPNPKLVYNSPEFPYYHELWNDRAAAARMPGHGDLVYARLYNFPGWTNDEKLIFFAFFEDNARWVYQCKSGGNWLATAADSALNFGLKFPEWKISEPCRSWGATALIEVSKEGVRGDGTCVEGSIKYHAMVARRLLELLKHHINGAVKLDSRTHDELVRTLNGMYDHMAHTLQPDNRVVMCGDSWYEDYSDELRQAGEILNRPDFVWIASQGKAGKPPMPASKVYPEAGYFIMRSDFGESVKQYRDAIQLFIHNGGWFGSHGHWDLTSLNLYAYGRTLIIDPGQYDYKPPEGIDVYWTSNIHSMLVCEERDVKREPGPSRWMSNSALDWFDGRHYGYNYLGNVEYVRRKVAFVKPDYFLVDDSAKTTRNTKWTQVWNLTDPDAIYNPQAFSIQTTFGEDGNVAILNLDGTGISVQRALGIAAAEKYPKTSIFRLSRQTDNPRFKTIVYPYSGNKPPGIVCQQIFPDNSQFSDLFYSLRINNAKGTYWAVFGEPGTRVTYRNGKHIVDAAFAVVRLDTAGKIRCLAWADGKELVFNGTILVKSNSLVMSLYAEYKGDTLYVEAREPDSTIAIRTGGAKRFVLNGAPVTRPVVKAGFFYPFGALAQTVTADDLSGFEQVTKTKEWTFVPDPAAWSGGYTHHETDPGRHETGDYVLQVPASGTYVIEVFLPKTTIVPSDRVEYTVRASAIDVAEPGGPILEVQKTNKCYVFTLNQQTMAGWVRLGKFTLEKGELRIPVRNVTPTDGLYLIVDAVRLIRLFE